MDNEKKKESFVMYHSYAKQTKGLTDEQLGKLLRYIFEYEITGNEPDINDSSVKMAFSFIKEYLDCNRVKYEAKCKKNSESGKTGADIRWRVGDSE